MRLLAVVASLVSGFAFTGLPSQAAETPPLQGRIVNGEDASPGSYPWMVALLRSSVSDNYQSQFCGGSLIASNVVLTAAHCTEGFRASEIEVLVGVTDLDAEGLERINVEQIINHRSYNDRTLQNDISLLVLESEINSSVIPLNSASPADGASVTAIGWGATNPEGTAYPSLLQVGQLSIDAGCEDWGGSYDSRTMICASGGIMAEPIDTCFGDSGGPLFSVDGDVRTLVGLTSWGSDPCAFEGLPGVYTRVSNYRSWVADSLKPSITRFSPRSGAPGTIVTISGSNLASVTEVRFGGLAADVISSSASSATVVVPSGAEAGRLTAVSSYTGSSTGVSRGTFRVSYPRPQVTRISPAEASPGDAVTISGKGFNGVTRVRFGNVDAPSFEVVSDRSIVAEVPIGAATGKVTVANPMRSASGGTFSLTPDPDAPRILGASTWSGPPGTEITVLGENLESITGMRIGSFDFIEYEASDTQIVAIIPVGASSGVLQVTSDLGTATSSREFDVRYPRPSISSISPTRASGGGLVTITGRHLEFVTDVRMGRTSISEFVIVGSNTITFEAPSTKLRSRVTVESPHGSVKSRNSLRIH